MAVGHNPGKNELLAMVESKMHEPKSTGFDDPMEWSADDMKAWLKEVSYLLLWTRTILTQCRKA